MSAAVSNEVNATSSTVSKPAGSGQAAILSEVKRKGRPPNKPIGAAQAYEALYPDSKDNWKDMVAAKKVSKELNDEVMAKRTAMKAERDAAIAAWDAENYELATKYKDIRGNARVKDQDRRCQKKMQALQASKPSVNEEALYWEKKYYALLERSADTTGEITAIFKKNTDGAVGSAANEAILIAQNNALQAEISDLKDTNAILNKKMDKKRSIISDKNSEIAELEKQLRSVKKQRRHVESENESESESD